MNNTFSANMFKIFDECPQKYHLIYEEGISLPQDKTTARAGENLHALISYFLKDKNVEKLTTALTDEEKNLWQNFLKLKITKDNVESCEETFNDNFDGTNWLTGRVDAIIKDKNTYTIYDWKTGKIPAEAEKSPQTLIYFFAIFAKLKQQKKINDFSGLKMAYVNLKTLDIQEINLDADYYKNIEHYICNKIKKINAFLKKEHTVEKPPICPNCKLKTFCNYNEN